MKRAGFTLIELLVVISILVIIAGLVVTAIAPTNSSKIRDAGRIAQATVLGARDRALYASTTSTPNRGFRLIVDPSNPMLATGFLYIQPTEPQSYPPGSFSLERVDALPGPNGDGQADSAEVVIVRPAASSLALSDWPALSQFFAATPRIRIPSGIGGQWYTFTLQQTGIYAFTQTNPILTLNTPFASAGAPSPTVTAYPAAGLSTYTGGDLELRNDLVPNHPAVYLPSGVVIDLNRSFPTSNTTTNPFPDIMFSPRGTVVGYLAGTGPIFLFLRDVRDALASGVASGGLDPSSPNLQGDQAILAIFPQTGLVEVYPVDTTDVQPSGGDGIADNPFSFARRGMRVSG